MVDIPRFLGAYRHRQYTVPLCLGVRDPGIAELRSTRVVLQSRVVCETI